MAWQKAVYEKASRLVRLHEAIKALEQRGSKATVRIEMRVDAQTEDPLDYRTVEAEVEYGPFVDLLRTEERTLIEDMARILRQVAQ